MRIRFTPERSTTGMTMPSNAQRLIWRFSKTRMLFTQTFMASVEDRRSSYGPFFVVRMTDAR